LSRVRTIIVVARHLAAERVLAEIPSVVNAVACAVEIQTAISAQKAALATRIGSMLDLGTLA